MSFSRRGFLYSALSVPVLSEGLLAALAESPVPDNPSQPILRLSNNENPYGPCTGACDSVTRAMPQGSRYPFAQRRDLLQRLAKLHDVSPEMVVLGNGSGEILRMAVSGLVTPGRTLVSPSPTFEAVVTY